MFSSYCFVDTSGWYSFVVPDDPNRTLALNALTTYRRRLITTDYILDELLTLLRVRGQSLRSREAWDLLHIPRFVTLLHLSEADLDASWRIFDRFNDKAWSFTDCTCKHIIDTYQIQMACSLDGHFQQFGNVTVVPARLP